MNNCIDSQKENIVNLFKNENGCNIKTIAVKKNDIIYPCGGGGSLFFIESGHVRVSTQTTDGTMCNIGFYTAGDIFGETGLAGEVIAETAVALTDSTLKKIDILKKLSMNKSDEISHKLIAYLAKTIIIHQNTLSSFIAFNSEKRLAYVLMRMSSDTHNEKNQLSLIKNKITHQDLSYLIGTTRSRVGHFMNDFLKKGIIKKSDNCFLVVDRNLIKKYFML